MINKILKTLLVLISIMPALAVFKVLPNPTPEMYSNMEAYNFIMSIMNVGYISLMMSVVFILVIYYTFKNKMALVALLLLPISLNIFFFHMVLDGGILGGGAWMGNILLAINLYYLYKNKKVYKTLM